MPKSQYSLIFHKHQEEICLTAEMAAELDESESCVNFDGLLVYTTLRGIVKN